MAYYRANTPWLDQQTIRNIDPIIDSLACASWEAVERWARGAGLMDVHRELSEVVEGYEGAGSPEKDAEMIVRIRELLEKLPDAPKVKALVDEQLVPLEAQLEAEARRLIGTHETRWRKLWRP